MTEPGQREGGGSLCNPGAPMLAPSYRHGPADSAETAARPPALRKPPAGLGRTHSSKKRTVSISPKAEAQMRGVKPRSSGLLMRLSPGRRGVVPLGCTPTHSPQGCGTGGGVGSWGQMWGREAYMWMTRVDMHRHTYRHRHTHGGSGHVSSHTHTPAGEVTLAHVCGHTPFLRCSFSWLSSPCAASWWMDRAGGQREAESTPVPSLLQYSVHSLSKVAPPSPCRPLLLSPGDQGPLTVQGGWQGRDFIAPLPVGEGC